MIGLLVYVLIVLIIFGALLYAVQKAPFLDPTFKNIAYAVVLILFVVVLLGLIGVIPGWSPLVVRTL